MQATSLAIPGLLSIVPKRHGDARGWFVESYNAERLADAGIGERFVQDNMSLSRDVGTVRGLHFQAPPRAQAKLVGCVAGAILDVVVDIRHGSPTFGRHVAVRLTAKHGEQLYVPAGFAHGFCTLEPDTIVMYKVTDYYAPAEDGGIAWDDPALGIDWPVGRDAAVVSDKDRCLPRLADCAAVFHLERA